MHASRQGNLEAVKLLIDKGVDVNARNRSGSSALIVAAYTNRPGVVKALLETGADTDIKNRKGLTALQAAVRAANVRVIAILGVYGVL